MGAIVGSEETATSLLRTLTDPQAYADRLKGLDEKAAVATNILEQAKQENATAAAERKAAEESYAATFKLLQEINAKSDDVKNREAALADRAAKIDTGEANLAAKQDKFSSDSLEISNRIAAREQKVAQGEQEFQARLAQLEATASQQLADKLAGLDKEYQVKAAAASAREALVSVVLSEAQAAKSAAEQAKLLYEAKVAELKKLVSA